jgi:hypothetical protein
MVDRVSQADIAGNTIDGNTLNGIYVSGNSGANLGDYTAGTIFDLPNYTDTGTKQKNHLYAIACDNGGYVAGYLGYLVGTKGSTHFTSTCINSLTASSTYTIIGAWKVTGHTNVTNPPSKITFHAGGAGTYVTTKALPMSWTLSEDQLTITDANNKKIFSGTITWSDANDITYTFGTSTLTLQR